MHLKINCKWNVDGTWCKNKKVKRSLFGFGARVCSEYNNKPCWEKEQRKNPFSPPPAAQPRKEEND